MPRSVLDCPFTPASAPANGATPAPRPEIITVTPQMARDWTERNTRNRPVRYNKVTQFARDMKAGKWALNGETIKIAADGGLLDGQHRLYACIKAEVPFESLVITGLPQEVQDTVDTGAARKMSDQLALHGEVNAALLAAITRWSFKWLHGVRTTGASDQEPSHSEMLAFIAAEPRLRDATAFAGRARKAFRSVNGSVWGMAWLLFHGSDHLAAEVFLDKLLTGADLSENHPALAFRNRIYRAKENGERLTQYEQLGYMIMAWNAFQDDRTLGKLLPPRGGFTPKTYPEPK